VAFGRLALRDFYPPLTQAERNEREAFLLEARYLMRDRFDAVEVWKTLGLDPAACGQHMLLQAFQASLLTCIVAIVKDSGLWRDTIRDGYRGWAPSATATPVFRPCRTPKHPSRRTWTRSDNNVASALHSAKTGAG
jgi:hypothetical protein